MSKIDRDCERLLSDGAAGRAATVIRRRDWASALFVGVRLTLEIRADDGDAFETWLAALPEIDLPLRGYFIADSEVVERRDGVAVVELLAVEES